MSEHGLDLALLALMLVAALWTILTADLMRSAIGLAATSAVLTLVLFRMSMPLAGVFELSVCAGLITVVFISTISLTKPATEEEARQHGARRWSRFAFLPLVLIAAGVGLWLGRPTLPAPAAPDPVEVQSRLQSILWSDRRFDLIGQILVMLTGVFGVVVLFKARGGASEETKE